MEKRGTSVESFHGCLTIAATYEAELKKKDLRPCTPERFSQRPYDYVSNEIRKGKLASYVECIVPRNYGVGVVETLSTWVKNTDCVLIVSMAAFIYVILSVYSPNRCFERKRSLNIFCFDTFEEKRLKLWGTRCLHNCLLWYGSK